MELLFAVITGVFFMLGSRPFMIIGAALTVCYPIFTLSRMNTYMKDAFNSNTNMRNARSRITFKEDHLESVSNISKSNLPYRDISRILETGTHYYIFSVRNTSYIIKKENCSPELLECLRSLKAGKELRHDGKDLHRPAPHP